MNESFSNFGSSESSYESEGGPKLRLYRPYQITRDSKSAILLYLVRTYREVQSKYQFEIASPDHEMKISRPMEFTINHSQGQIKVVSPLKKKSAALFFLQTGCACFSFPALHLYTISYLFYWLHSYLLIFRLN